MNILILGATGATGKHLVSQALDLGYRVTALSRHPERLGVSHANLTAMAGDAAEDPGSVQRALPRQDAVLSALGRGMSFSPHALIARSVRNVVPAMAQFGPRRLIWLSSYGVATDHDGARGLPLLFFRTLLRGIYADKAIGEAAMRKSTLEWTLVNPVMLTNDPEIEKYRVGERLDVGSGAKLSRASVAHFMLKCLDDPSTIGRRLVMGPS